MTDEEKISRYIPIPTRIILYSQAAGQCSMENCNKDLIFPITNGKSHLGNIAHIEALNKEGARYNPNLSVEERNSEDNLMIVCKNCHEIIDADPEKYTVEYLKEIKRHHIKKMKILKENSSVNFDYEDLFIASKNIIEDKPSELKTKNETIEDYTILEIEYKMNKNELTTISKDNIINGITQQPLIEKFFIDMSKEDEDFFDKVKNSLKNSYNKLIQEYSGDLLFLKIYESFKRGLTNTQQSACLAIIVYFFTICELFEK